MTWRTWLYDRLGTVVDSESVFSGGALTTPPVVRPFVVYRLQTRIPRLNDGGYPVRVQTFAEVWVYDDPGAYDRIDSIINLIRVELVGQISDIGMVCCEWVGDSGELADDEMKAITRNSTYQLIGGSV